MVALICEYTKKQLNCTLYKSELYGMWIIYWSFFQKIYISLFLKKGYIKGYILILTQGYFLLFTLERVEGGIEREREKHQLVESQTGDQTRNLGMCPDQESNLQPFGAWEDIPTNWATWQ